NYCEKPNHWALKCKQIRSDNIDKRWETVKKNKLCFGCFSKEHDVTNCKTRRRCTKDQCEQFHNSLLHRPSKAEVPTKPTEKHKELELISILQSQQWKKQVLLRIAPVRVKRPDGEVQTYALFDEGSTCTLVDTIVAK
ncbi:unnamed protein product, partial [Allacma fusca]